nr:polysaccharide pyruvyl transferase family protein [uncultured Gellertiella sp.]
MSHTRPLAFLSFKTQFENVGDALINRELLRLVAERAEVHLDLSRCPPEFAENMQLGEDYAIHPVGNANSVLAKAALSALSGREAFYFLSPGGYVGEVSVVRFGLGLVNSLVLLLLMLAGVRICHVGVSYERLGVRQKILLKLRRRLLYRHIVRDRESAEYARSIGLHIDGIMPDLAFGALGILGEPVGPRPYVALSFRVDQSACLQARIVAFVQELDATLPKSVPVKLICQVERDAPFLRRLEKMFSDREITYAEVFETIDTCFQNYDDVGFIVSNRLHALLMGTVRGAIPIALVRPELNAKIYGVFDAMDASDCIVQLSPDAVKTVGSRIVSGLSKPIDVQGQKAMLRDVFRDIFQSAAELEI